MSQELVTYDLQPPAAIVSLNRADRRNALSRTLISELIAAFERARDDASARCVILTGQGSVFCAGMDLAELEETAKAGADERSGQTIWTDALRLGKLYDLIYTLSKPTIAAVNGSAVAGGAGLVTVCDLALAVPSARFGYPEVRRGLVAAMVMTHLMRHVGERQARYLLLTGELIDSAEAYRTGLINAIVEQDHLLPRALTWARSIAEGGPDALGQTKALLRQFSHQAISVEETAQASAAPRLTQECQEGLRAFFEKRPPRWVSR